MTIYGLPSRGKRMYDISVVIATRNEQKYIEKTLRHLLLSVEEAKKSGVNAEVIIIDSSDDNTKNVARKFIEKIYPLPAQGVSKARNYGAKLCEGDIVVFMDADTVVQKKTLADVFNAFMSETVISAVAYVLPLNYRELPLPTKVFYVIDKIFIKACGVVPLLVRFYNRGDIVAIRKNTLNTVGGFDESLYMMEITDLLVAASKHGRIKVLPAPVFESSRRLKKWGLLRLYGLWWRNYFSFYLFGRLLEATYEAIR